MARLFIAIDLPAATLSALAQLQPQPVPGLRLTTSSQMHLTLHFSGESDPDPLATALTKIQQRAFTLEVQGVGQFPPRGIPSVLWAGIAASAELTELHAGIADALRAAGIPTESRTYSPHITLARCTPKVPPSIVEEFLRRNERLSLPPVTITDFHLYSSLMASNGPVYHCEQSLMLSTSSTP